jgi:hypothetical protein
LLPLPFGTVSRASHLVFSAPISFALLSPQDMIDQADRDGDGEINPDEFYRIMKKRGDNPLDDLLDVGHDPPLLQKVDRLEHSPRPSPSARLSSFSHLSTPLVVLSSPQDDDD